MKKNLLWLNAIFILCSSTSAQNPTDVPGIDTLASHVKLFGETLPQEKVYLHIDNTCYFVGDTIWYKGYVTRSDKGTLTDLSRILYVELLTPDGYLVERQQLEMPDGTAHGAFLLTDSLYAGYYELRAYTRWMLNFGRYEHPHSPYTEEMFYNKQMAKDYFRDYDKLYSRVFPVFDRPSSPGTYPKDMTLRPLRRYFRIRKGKPDMDLKFYPEGGTLVAGLPGHVAFELNDENGQHVDAELTIYDCHEQIVARTHTVHRGRGTFYIPQVSAEERYKAVFRYGKYEYEVELPEVEDTGCTLRITQNDSLVHTRIESHGLSDEKIGLQILHGGATQAFLALELDSQGKASADVPADSLAEGVNQMTLFDGRGHILAERLFFVNHHNPSRTLLTVNGVKREYAPFEPIEIRLKLHASLPDSARLSISVRDHSTDESTYDNGTILTEMLLCSDLKGFVEDPGYYFEADDSIHRRNLDLLMLVQGWRRYEWHEMAGVEPFRLSFYPERMQTLTGSVHPTYSLLPEADYGDTIYIPGMGKELPLYTTAGTPFSLDDLYGTTYSGKMKKEVTVTATFAQGTDIVEASQNTKGGRFTMLSPILHGDCSLFLTATDSTKFSKRKEKRNYKEFHDEEAYPDYYVKQDRFYPVFPKPYSYYHDAVFENMENTSLLPDSLVSGTHLMSAVTVRNKRGGLRKLNLKKPTLVVDAYEAFNLAADYGLNSGMYDWRTFTKQVCTAYIGDMNQSRHYFIQERYDSLPLNHKDKTLPVGVAITNQTEAVRRKYHKLYNLDKLYIYTDYSPREENSWKYSGTDQPDVVVDYRLFPGEARQYTFRDRRYLVRGYSVCKDFYHPDYSRRPLPGTADYRRTLYWNPEVKFNAQGEAQLRFYNNNKRTTLSIEAEGITRTGLPVTTTLSLSSK